MKISKLFHWLYAFLMFLPVLALSPSLFYFAFNQQSQNYTDVQVNETYEYETNEVSATSDLVVGNIYQMNLSATDVNDISNVGITTKDLRVYIDSELIFNVNKASGTFVLYFGASYINVNYTDISYGFGIYPKSNITNDMKVYFVYSGDYMTSFIQYITASDYLGEKNVDVVRSEQSPMNIFYTAVNYVYDLPIFSWAKTSFLALPITYITGLFGMGANNVVNYYLSYWLAISIVYLVFDLVMYVPLLVHRWLDKGIME